VKSHYLGNGLLDALRGHQRPLLVNDRKKMLLIATSSRYMTADQSNLSIRCLLFSSRKIVLRGWLTQLTLIEGVPESRVQHGAKKTELKIRLPGRAVRDNELRR
jgi:hypothetical protein